MTDRCTGLTVSEKVVIACYKRAFLYRTQNVSPTI